MSDFFDELPIPAEWDGLIGATIPYWDSLDILEVQWTRTASFREAESGTALFMEYMFWRRVSIVWVCTTIEAFLNEEGVSWLGERFYKANIERQSVRQKIALIYALKYRKRIFFKKCEKIKVFKLFEMRNRIVHPKSHEVLPVASHEDKLMDLFHSITFDELRQAVRTITTLLMATGVGEDSE